MKKEIKIFRDEDAIKAGLQSTRSDILSLLKLNDLTISQIVDSLGKEKSTIYRHIKKLEKHGYVKVKDEVYKRGAYEKIYTRTAKFFIMTPKSISSDKPTTVGEWDKKETKEVLKQLETIGFENDLSDELVEQLSKFFIDIGNDFTNRIQENIGDIEEMNILEFLRIKVMFLLLRMDNDDELKERIERIRSEFKEKYDVKEE
ncbi:MAG: ArsR/SmtB family transcription factor [Thermoplasmatota archaeon]